MASRAAKFLFRNRVVVITGSGNGLGREYALLFARRGAKIVVNDYGGDISGGSNTSGISHPADIVVEEIRSFGGEAVPNYDSVEAGGKIIDTAIQNFGRIDILVNNAGILRDRSFVKLSEDDWDVINRIHLRGSFLTTKAAWPYFRKQNYGRIVMTTSTAGLYGAFGQTNYSAAKMALVGFSSSLAAEGAKYNIFCNAIAPIAGSRLTQTVLPQELIESLKPSFIAPVVAYLCHESCEENGSIIECAAGWAAKTKFFRSAGVQMNTATSEITVESVAENWGAITDLTTNKLQRVNNQQEVIEQVVNQLSGASTEQTSLVESTSPQVGTKDVLRFNDPTRNWDEPSKYQINHRDIVLYNIAVGAKHDELHLVYENDDNFMALPTMAVLPAQRVMMTPEALQSHPLLADADLTRALHGEQYVEILQPFPTEGILESKVKVVDVLDKKSGALVLFDVDTFDENGTQVCFNQFSIFIMGLGGFGGARYSSAAKPLGVRPRREVDKVIREQTSVDQAVLYRLCGDWNPLHVDPNFASASGFSKPILHGLCSFGFATRHVISSFCNQDPSLVKAVKARFSKPIYPGETIQTEMWVDDVNACRVHLESKAVESGNVIITGAYVDLKQPVSFSKDHSKL